MRRVMATAEAGTLGIADRIVGAVVGTAVGDALGATTEFLKPGSFEPIPPDAGLVGGGCHQLAPVCDDTDCSASF